MGRKQHLCLSSVERSSRLLSREEEKASDMCGKVRGSGKGERRADSSITEKLSMGLEENGAWDESPIS